MAITDAQYQAAIIADLNLGAAGKPAFYAALSANVATYWSLYASKALLINGQPLQYLYTKRHCVQALRGSYADYTDYEADVSAHDSDIADHFAALEKDLTAEIIRVEGMAKGLRTAVSGALTTVLPVAPAAGTPDPSDSVYRGDPLRSDTPSYQP